MSRKYLVFKQEELFRLLGELALPSGAPASADCAPIAEHIVQRVSEAQLKDAVVIRKQDIFSASALHAYADNLKTVMELQTILGHEVPAYFEELYHYFKAEAFSAEDTPAKVPD